jgi:hypothetical protein
MSAPSKYAGRVLAATALAVALTIAPLAARPALAAGGLRLAADATYTLDPPAGRVHVAVEVTATSLKPNSATFIYSYGSIGFPLQPEASGIRVSGGASSISTTRHAGFIEAIVHLRANLYYRDTTRFTIRYDLVGGAPRSVSPVRVGKAFSTFGVWAWGDAGRSTVEVHTPAGYATKATGGPLQATSGAAGQTLGASPADPDTFFAIVSAENVDAYAETRLSFDGGVEIVVLAWPEDDTWSGSVGATLRGGIPKLRGLIGLAWPVAHDLDVRERYTPALEGYAGIFFTDDQHIDVSEDLDPVVITHETSHAWFNEHLFSERWIYEGLAQEYAWRTLRAIGVEPGPPATKPDTSDPGYVNLAGWTFPRVIRDQETDDRERFGYEAAFWVVHQIVDAVGVERMRTVFAAAAAHLTAYPGSGAPEAVGGDNSWRRLLDLVSPIDAPDPPGVEAAFIEYAVAAGDAHALFDRRAARDAYRALVDQGAGWLPPWYVRRSMGAWAFVAATKAMDEARSVLELRVRVATAANALGLAPDDALRSAYEGAQDALAGAITIATDQLATLRAIAEAKATLEATPDLVTQVGLIGEAPRAAYEAARTAFEAGQLDEAARSAAAARAVLAAAPTVGRDRLLAVGGAALGLLLVLALIVVLVRRRRTGHRASAVATATLAADPAAASAPPGARRSDDDGGHGAGGHGDERHGDDGSPAGP